MQKELTFNSALNIVSYQYNSTSISSFSLAEINFDTGFPIMRFSSKDGESHTQYKGPKDFNSMMFFINEMTGNGEQSKKVFKKSIHKKVSTFGQNVARNLKTMIALIFLRIHRI